MAELHLPVNPIPTGQGLNQPLYERHVTKSGRNRVNLTDMPAQFIFQSK